MYKSIYFPQLKVPCRVVFVRVLSSQIGINSGAGAAAEGKQYWSISWTYFVKYLYLVRACCWFWLQLTPFPLSFYPFEFLFRRKPSGIIHMVWGDWSLCGHYDLHLSVNGKPALSTSRPKRCIRTTPILKWKLVGEETRALSLKTYLAMSVYFL